MSADLTASRDHVVYFHYELRGEDGAVRESSRSDAHPATALMGHNNLMPGLETALEGRRSGESFEVAIAPDNAFGPRRPDWTERVSKKRLRGAARLKPGAVAQMQTDHGSRAVTVIKVGGKFIDVDLNHPLAGQTVTVAVEIIDIRAATPEELDHGHVHGAGGHHH